MASAPAAWDEAAEADLLEDPRFVAALAFRKSGSYEDALEFLGELLKTFDDHDSPPLHTALLHYNYGSTLVCIIERQAAVEEEEEEENATNESDPGGFGSSSSRSNSSSSSSSDAADGPAPKRVKTEDPRPSTDGGSAPAEEGVLGKHAEDGEEADGADDDNEKGGDEDDENDQDEVDEEDDETIAWQYLDSARDLYSQGLEQAEASPGSASLAARLRSDLARAVSRIGDLNLLTGAYGDALVEWEQVIKLRGAGGGASGGGAATEAVSVIDTCKVGAPEEHLAEIRAGNNPHTEKAQRTTNSPSPRLFLFLLTCGWDPPCSPQLVDTHMQVAFCYLRHVKAHGEVDVVVRSAEAGNPLIVVAVGPQCLVQAGAYAEQAKTALSGLITRLARDKANCSDAEKEEICVQYELLGAFESEIALLRP